MTNIYYYDNILLENLFIAESVAASIIENYNIIGIYICTQCGDEIETVGDSIINDVIRHVITHTTYTGLAGIYMCSICNAEFKSEQERKLHTEIHNINTNIDYKYICPVCENGYHTQYELGEHFMEEHNNYNELEQLDDIETDGYPTFDVLHKIKMMRYVTIYDDIKIDECPICYYKYNSYKRSYTQNDTEQYNRYDKYAKFFCDMRLMSKKSNIKIEPIKLLCCNTIICSNCLVQHIRTKRGEPECPYCRKNHTQHNKRYIVFDDKI